VSDFKPEVTEARIKITEPVITDEKLPRARITIVHEFDLSKVNYRYSGGPKHDDALTEEEYEALDGKKMLELEKSFLETHLTDISDILADFDPSRDESDSVKWELVEDATAD
jgi:hypothetical protein